MEVGSITLSQFRNGIHAGCFQQIRILFPDASDPEEVGFINTAEDNFLADSAFLGDASAALGRPTGLEETLSGVDACPGQLRRYLFTDPFNVDY